MLSPDADFFFFFFFFIIHKICKHITFVYKFFFPLIPLIELRIYLLNMVRMI